MRSFPNLLSAIRFDRVGLSALVTAVALSISLAMGASAQTITLPAGSAPGYAIGYGALNGPFVAVDPMHPLPIAGFQENVALITANTPAAVATVYGGDYIFAQDCSGYGTIALQVRGPDGVTFQTLISKSAADGNGGTGIALGSNAIIRATATGTTACNATLSRVP